LSEVLADKAIIESVLCKFVQILNVFPGRLSDDYRCKCGLTTSPLCQPPKAVEADEVSAEEGDTATAEATGDEAAAAGGRLLEETPAPEGDGTDADNATNETVVVETFTYDIYLQPDPYVDEYVDL